MGDGLVNDSGAKTSFSVRVSVPGRTEGHHEAAAHPRSSFTRLSKERSLRRFGKGTKPLTIEPFVKAEEPNATDQQ